MKTKEENTIVIYNDLFSDKDWNAWNSLESFRFESYSGEEEVFNKMSGIEVVLDGTHGDSRNTEKLFDDYEAIVSKVFNNVASEEELYLIVSEYALMTKNRVRSFKGILPKKELSTESFLEMEIPFEKDYSIFVAMVKLTSGNLKPCFDYFLDNSRCFVIASNQSLFNKESLEKIMKDCFNHDNGVYLDYYKLFVKYGLGGDLIFRSGGDGGDQEVSFQCFCLNDKQDDIIKKCLF